MIWGGAWLGAWLGGLAQAVEQGELSATVAREIITADRKSVV